MQTYILTVDAVTFVKCCGLSQNYPP
jgi:hypothetical protein